MTRRWEDGTRLTAAISKARAVPRIINEDVRISFCGVKELSFQKLVSRRRSADPNTHKVVARLGPTMIRDHSLVALGGMFCAGRSLLEKNTKVA